MCTNTSKIDEDRWVDNVCLHACMHAHMHTYMNTCQQHTYYHACMVMCHVSASHRHRHSHLGLTHTLSLSLKHTYSLTHTLCHTRVLTALAHKRACADKPLRAESSNLSLIVSSFCRRSLRPSASFSTSTCSVLVSLSKCLYNESREEDVIWLPCTDALSLAAGALFASHSSTNLRACTHFGSASKLSLVNCPVTPTGGGHRTLQAPCRCTHEVVTKESGGTWWRFSSHGQWHPSIRTHCSRHCWCWNLRGPTDARPAPHAGGRR